MSYSKSKFPNLNLNDDLNQRPGGHLQLGNDDANQELVLDGDSILSENDLWKKTLEIHNKIQKDKYLLANPTLSFDLPISSIRINLPSFLPSQVEQVKAIIVQEKSAKSFVETSPKLVSNSSLIIENPKKSLEEVPQKNPFYERKRIYQTFHLTGGEPPKTPPQETITEPEEDYYPTKSFPKSLHQIIGFRGTDDLYQMSIYRDNYSRPATPNKINNFPNVGPKVNTGLHQLKKETKISPNGVPIHSPKFHPLTIGSRLHHRSLMYENSKTRLLDSRQSNMETKSSTILHNLYLPTRGKKVVMHTNIRAPVEVLKPPQRESAPAQSSYLIGTNNLRNFRPPHFLQGPALSRYQNQHQMRNSAISHYPLAFPRFPPPRAQQLRQQSTDLQNRSNIVETPQQKKYRPSQLLPLHIPGPKRENIFIGSYNSDSERQTGTSKVINRAIKSRRR